MREVVESSKFLKILLSLSTSLGQRSLATITLSLASWVTLMEGGGSGLNQAKSLIYIFILTIATKIQKSILRD